MFKNENITKTLLNMLCEQDSSQTGQSVNTVPSAEDSRIRNDSEFAVTITDLFSTAAISTSLLRVIVCST